MEDLFAILLLLSITALFVGLINPKIVIRWGDKKTRGKVLLYYGLGTILFFVLFGISSDSTKESETTVKKEKKGQFPADTSQVVIKEKQLETADNTIPQELYINSKIEFYKKYLENEPEIIKGSTMVGKFKKEMATDTKQKLNEINYMLTDWIGNVGVIDMFGDKESTILEYNEEADIEIIIQDDIQVGKRTVTHNLSKSTTYLCKYSLSASQAPSKKYGYKGIKRSGVLYEQIKRLKEGQRVKFTAKVVDFFDFIPKTGIAYSTTFYIEIITIEPIK